MIREAIQTLIEKKDLTSLPDPLSVDRERAIQ